MFFPDGTRIAFTCQGGRAVCVMAADGGDRARLADLEGYPDAGPAVTPDGRVAFVKRHGDLDAVYVVEVGGGSGPVLLADLGDSSSYPAFAAAGDRLAFTRMAEEGSYVHVIEGDGADSRRVGPPGAYEPALSPDGRRIAFVRDVPAGGQGHYELAVMNIDGSEEKRLTEGGDNDNHHPAFAPDGRSIAFDRSHDGAPPGVFVVDADGSDERQVVLTGTQPAFSPDGHRIAFVRDGDIWVIDVDGSDEKRLTVGADREGGTP